MIANEIRKKLQDIVRGELQEGTTDSCGTIRNLLCKSFRTSPTVKSEFESKSVLKKEQIPFLTSYAQQNGFWQESLPSGSRYLAEGGESKVYLAADGRSVIKLNDASYYATWTEYFNNLVLHNLLFPNTAYTFLGFTEIEGELLAVVQQPFVKGEQADLLDIEDFLNYNGFKKKKRQDYYNAEFDLALEDIHDENVIANDGVLFFIDTVFYIMERK